MATPRPSSSRPGLTAAPAVDPVVAATALSARAADLASQTERDRQLPAELVEAFRAAGFFRLSISRQFGGLELDPVTAARVVEEVAVGDGSAAWCLMIADQNAAFSSFMSDEVVQAVWGSGAIVAGTARPIGRAVITDGGYTVSGRWPFASGSSHADWFAAECVVYEGDSPKRDAQGNDVSRFTLFPRDRATIHDTWHTMGLRGTASNDFSTADTFVPEAFGFQILVDPPIRPSPVGEALPLAFINQGTHAVGVARGALEAAKAIAATKIGWGDQPVRKKERVQTLFGEASTLVLSARTHLYAVAAELLEESRAGRPGDPLLRARVRLANSHAAKSSLQAVELLHSALGTSAVFQNTSLERQLRDLRMANAHVMVGPLTWEAGGRVELGMEPDFPFF